MSGNPHTGQPTGDNARQSAVRGLITSGALPPADAGINAWADKLAQADTENDFRDLLSHVLTADDGALPALHALMSGAADWCQARGLNNAAAELLDASGRLIDLGDELSTLNLDSQRPGTHATRASAATVRSESVPSTLPGRSNASGSPNAAPSPRRQRPGDTPRR